MIRSRPIGSTRRISDYGSRGTIDVDLIRCVDGRDSQIHWMWCLGSDSVTRETYQISQLEVGDVTMGKFIKNFIYENRRRISIIVQLYINGSVQLLGIPTFVINSGLSFIKNLQAPTVISGWGGTNTPNQNWGVIPGRYYSNVAFTWGSNTSYRLYCMPRSLENPRAAARRVRDELCCQGRRDFMQRHSTSCNPIVNTRIHRCGDDQ